MTPSPDTLPELDDARVETMERAVFARIARERATSRARRRRWWTAGAAAAAVVVATIAITPWVTVAVGDRTTTFSAGTVELAPVTAPALPGAARDESSGGSDSSSADAAAQGREIVSNASATVVVEDVRAAADAIRQEAERRGGYVESQNIANTSSAPRSAGEGMIEPAWPYAGAGDGWIVVRVPADQLTEAIEDLGAIGEVSSSSISAQDVTDQAIDLRARITAAEASVTRLTELMSQAQSTADLIAAETALQERQASLDADRQQLAFLEDQVDLASLSVQLTPRTVTVEADPAGFGDGIAAGWNGLVATLNGIVIAFGFLIPWIAVLAVIGAAAWGVLALVRRARRRPRRAAARPRQTDAAGGGPSD
jgi:hypothetical protein